MRPYGLSCRGLHFVGYANKRLRELNKVNKRLIMPTYRGLFHFVYAAMEGILKACKTIKAKKIFFAFIVLQAQKLPGYSQSKAPFFHSYKNPIVKINKNTIIDQNPNKPILLRETAQGNKKVTSKSNIINKIETR